MGKIEKRQQDSLRPAFETLLDHSLHGVIYADSEGGILAVNQVMEQMTGKSREDMVGQPVCSVVPQIGKELLAQVLEDGNESTVMIEQDHVLLYAMIAPIISDSHVDGAILTFWRVRPNEPEKETAAVPVMCFDRIVSHSEAMKACIRQAKLYAMASFPVVLVGEVGTEIRTIAECMHSFGPNGAGSFLEISCAGLSPEQQNDMLFGEKGAVWQAQGGTLFLRDLESLAAAEQYALCRLILCGEVVTDNPAKPKKARLHMFAASEKPLAELVSSGALRKDLYYAFSGMELLIPPLRQCPEDLRYHMEMALKTCSEQYGRYHVLTGGALKYLMSCEWPGNRIQIESFFESLVLTAQRRSIDEVAVKKLMEKLYGQVTVLPQETTQKQPSPRAEKIKRALEECGGSRKKTAELLGIGTATLWRQMKKYNIEWE